MADDDFGKLQQIAVRALARREHSRLELFRKLSKHHQDPALIDRVLQQLIVKKYQDDERFAAAYIRYRALRGYGPERIGYELQERGVASIIVGRCLAVCELDWQELASEVQQKKFKTAAKDFSERVKQSKFLQYRGFTTDQIKKIVNK